MAITVQRPFESAVTEMCQDACVGSAIENGTTIILFDLRQHDLQAAWGTKAKLCWRKEPYAVEMHARSTFHHPITYRCIVAQGSSLNDPHQRVDFPPTIQGVSTSQHMRHSVIRLACDLAVVCGVSLRHLALLFSVRFLMPIPQASMQRWLDDIGVHVPTPEAMRRHLLALAPATACHMDGDYPRGTATCVMVVKDEHDRLLITQEAASEHGEEARPCLPRGKDLGLKVTATFSDSSPSFTEAIKAGSPQARLQADHFHTVKHIWGHLKKSLLSSRRKVKASGAEKNDAPLMAWAKQLGKVRGVLLKQPTHFSLEAKQTMAELEREEAGLVQRFRHMIRPLVHIFDHAHSAAQAKLRLPQWRPDIHGLEDRHLAKLPQFFDDHWEQALRYLRNKGMGKHRRGSNSESGMRLLRRLEKNHDGVRSAATRQHYIQIYQAIKYLSLDIADFLEKGPQLAELPDV
jgi:hypothetical protein